MIIFACKKETNQFEFYFKKLKIRAIFATHFSRGIAQSGSALRSGRRGPGFKSPFPDSFNSSMMRSFRISAQIILFFYLSFSISCDQKRDDSGKSLYENQSENTPATEIHAETDMAGSQPEISSNLTQAQKVEMDTILGPWLRPDGNYILEFTKINNDKSLDASYYNPKPIHVSLAQIKQEDRIKIYVEFDDVNYRGSYYDLQYDPVNDALTGNYYQATYGQTYAIAFIRYRQPD